MNKQEFLTRLREGLSGLPRDEITERLSFYSEMIDDRVEDGLSEEAAVAGIGPVDNIVTQIVAEIPLPKLVRERIKPTRKIQPWEILLLILGFPVWFPLLIAAAVILFTVYLVIWVVALVLWVVEAAVICCVPGSIGMGVLLLCRGDSAQGWILIFAGLVLTGCAILLFFGCRAATKGAVILSKKIPLGVKSLFLRKEKTT